jgi:hypothetical protein
MTLHSSLKSRLWMVALLFARRSCCSAFGAAALKSELLRGIVAVCGCELQLG